MEFLRLEIRRIQNNELPPIILPKVTGHRRVYTAKYDETWFLLNVMCIGDSANGVTYGKVDDAILQYGPEEYFKNLTIPLLVEAILRGAKKRRVVLLMGIDEKHPQLFPVLQNVQFVMPLALPTA